MILNLGCGNNRISKAINVDIDFNLKPDLVSNFIQGLPFKDNSIDEIYLFHTIEHIQEIYHAVILQEIRRILVTDGLVMLSFPEFIKVATNYTNNYKGMRDFWKKTIYGLQRTKNDFHVSLMNSEDFQELMRQVGFYRVKIFSEKDESFNTVISAIKGYSLPSYEQVLFNEIFSEEGFQ